MIREPNYGGQKSKKKVTEDTARQGLPAAEVLGGKGGKKGKKSQS